ncbi:MFS transporter [Nocardia panacis]|uniref:MFS transporter n=1 Tax=Nocardia panacis TaxID=2340916 RepID=A0A3A4K124_9NOCA|nr:MFS transporter [Nocardia panacis]RJO77943.1 MFS transporter [Nocardia panacis]
MFVLAVLMFCVFSVTTGEFVVAGILPDVAGDLDIPVGAAGLLVTAYAIGMIIGGPVLTAITAALNRKRLMLALLAFAGIGNLVSACAPGYGWLLAARVVTALVTSTFFAQAVVVAVRSAPPDRTATTVARLAFGMNLAMILGAPLGTAIGHQWGWRATFAAVGLGCLLGTALIAMLVATPPDEQRGSAIAELRVLLRRPVLLALALTAIGNVGVLMVFTYLAPLLTDLAGHPQNRLPILMLGYGIGATLGNLLGGTLYDRNPRLWQPALLALLALTLAAAWLLARTPLPAAAAVILIGILGFAIIPGMQAGVLRSATEAPTLSMAVNASAYQVAAACAGLAGGLVADSATGPRPIYLIAAALTACGVLLTVLSAATRTEPEKVAAH